MKGDRAMLTTRRLSLAAGLTAAVLLGSGLVAVTLDTVTSPDNAIHTPDPPAPTSDLQVAKIAGSGSVEDCGVFSDGTVAAAQWWFNGSGAGDGEVPPGDGNISLSQFDRFCVRNNGTEPFDLGVRFINIVDSEFGSCSTGEADAEASPASSWVSGSCADGDEGELSHIIDAALSSPQWPECPTHPYMKFRRPDPEGLGWNGSLDSDLSIAPVVVGTLAPGQTCVYYFLVQMPTADPVAESDRVQWDIQFSAEG